MTEFAHDAHDAESLLRIIETTQQVQRRAQFFVWIQADLQRWLPHKLIVCGAYDLQQRAMVFDVLNSVPLPGALDRDIRQPQGTFLDWCQQQWLTHQRQPLRLDLSSMPDAELVSRWQAEEYRDALVHGLSRPGRPDDIESFFVLMSPGVRVSDGALQAFGWLMPHVHIVWQRVFDNEKAFSDVSARPRLSAGRQDQITRRETELLYWVREGLSNQQIADKLGISTLTVKNHVQKILRKLGAANRTQAVAIAMTQQLLPGAAMAGLTHRKV